MRRNLTTAVLTAGLFLGFGAGSAQEMAKPGAEHKVLETLVGKWSAKVKLFMDPKQPPSDGEGTMVRKWIMDGRFLQEDFEGKFMGMDFKGLGLTGYDVMKKKYVGTWVDSMTTSIMFIEGTYDAKTKTFTLFSDDIDPMTGKKAKTRDVIRVVSNDQQIQEMYQTPEGGKESKMMEIQYNRVK